MAFFFNRDHEVSIDRFEIMANFEIEKCINMLIKCIHQQGKNRREKRDMVKVMFESKLLNKILLNLIEWLIVWPDSMCRLY